ncbi:hypothetical protein CPB85DRAFT_371299 [Mucidula mucida]|nr:hypothetical protein CPB85DRAFT_371299 [Mucidula mucida]
MSISCAICLLLYKEPSSVPCGHVFCADCLSAYIARTKKNGRASCPSCRKEFHCDVRPPQPLACLLVKPPS